MTRETQDKSTTWFQWLAVTTVIMSYLLIALGGVVRVTGADAACGGDWPACNGKMFPSLTWLTMIDYGHRVSAAVVTLLTLGLAVLAWTRHRANRLLVGLSSAALALVVLPSALGALSATREVIPAVVTAHLGLAQAYFAVVIALTIHAFGTRITSGGESSRRTWATQPGPLALAAGALVFLLMLTGAYTSTGGARLACQDWPFCGGHVVPTGWTPVDIQLTHRWVALFATVAVLAVALWARRSRIDAPAIVGLSTAAAVLMVAQIFVGAASVWFDLNPILVAAHLAVATVVWGVLVSVPLLDRMLPVAAVGERHAAPRPLRRVAADYVTLTKPNVMTLLLLTTLCAMLIAQAGLPPLRPLVWALIGGALATGGAAALNQYLDRDIDALMSRTRRRPLPEGRIPPVQAVIFGVTLSVLSVYVLAVFVNPLAAALSLSGNLFYVFVYTMWLKRSTPQNIVIGGAAGAVPPLVGWAAVTNSVSLAAWIMFAVIFYWTPPHFWSLALYKSGDYEAARVPMLPAVYGETETRRHIFLYTILLVIVSLFFFPLQVMGPFYLVCALILGGIFLYKSYQLTRLPAKDNHLARPLFFFSLWYLALLFAAMVVDRVVFF